MSLPLPSDTAVAAGVLDNGLRYYVRANRRPEQRAELRLAVRAGSVLEADNERGLAHFLEHMAFNGTRNFPKQELTSFIESIGMRFGANLNAGTGFDRTVYILTIPTQPRERLGQALQILEDWAHQITFDPAEIDKERGVIVEEWRLGLGARSRIWDKHSQVLLAGSRYAERRPIGDTAVINNFPPKRMTDFYRRWYRPDLMAVVAVGDFDRDSVVAMIRERFSAVPKTAKAMPRPFHPVPRQTEPRFSVVTDPEATGASVSVNFLMNPDTLATLGDFRRELSANMLLTMLNQRLEELKRRPDPPFLEGYAYKYGYVEAASMFVLGAEVADDGVLRGLETLLTEARRVELHGFTPGELARARAELLRQMEQQYLERDKTESRALAWGYLANFTRASAYPDAGTELELAREMLPGITLEEVNALAGELITRDNRVYLASAPEKDGLAVPSGNDIRRLAAAVEGREVEPYADNMAGRELMKSRPKPGRVARTKRFPGLGMIRWTLSNGAQVYLKPTDFKNDEVLLRCFAPGGTSLADSAGFPSALFAAQVVSEGGLGDFDRVELEKHLAGRIAAASPWIRGYDQGITGSASPADLELMLQMVHLGFTAPRRDSAAFASFLGRTAAGLRHRDARPETALADSFQLIMGGRSFRARPVTSEVLAGVGLDASVEFYRRRFADASGFTFILVGSFDPDSVRPLVEAYLGGLPGRGRRERWRDTGMRYPAGAAERSLRKGIEHKSSVRMAFVSEFTWSQRDRLLADALSDYLDIRLREAVREDRGGTYSIWSYAQSTAEPVPQCAVHIGFGTAPERSGELTAAVFAVADSARNSPMPEAYLAKIREINLREWETKTRENGYWAGLLQQYLRHGEDPGRITEYPAAVKALKSEDIRRAALRHLDPRRYVKVSLFPEGWEAVPEGR
jgi:zinc protease